MLVTSTRPDSISISRAFTVVQLRQLVNACTACVQTSPCRAGCRRHEQIAESLDAIESLAQFVEYYI